MQWFANVNAKLNITCDAIEFEALTNMNAKLNITCDIIEFEALYKYEREAKYYMLRNQKRKCTLNTSTDLQEKKK